jgi:hypothetical protein
MVSSLGVIYSGDVDKVADRNHELDAEKRRILDPTYAAFN